VTTCAYCRVGRNKKANNKRIMFVFLMLKNIS
jgi:hypothetical protein